MEKPYSFKDHPEHKEQLGAWAERWTANALSTKAMSDEDCAAIVVAMEGLYSAANLKPPTRRVFCASPISGGIAAAIASGVWWLRKNPEQQAKLFGRSVSEAELLAALREACALAVKHSMGVINCEEPEPMRFSASVPTASATYSATDSATDSATRSATDSATASATYSATASATDSATESAKIIKTDSAFAALTRFLVICTRYWWRLRNGGNMWSGWCSYLSFFRHVAKLNLRVYDKWQHYENAAIHGGPRFMHEEFWIVCDRPEMIGRDEQNRSHSASGPALRWRDGWEIYSWHGMRVNRRLIVAPETITSKEVLDERNAQVRSLMIERFGMERLMREAGGKVVHKDRRGRLLRLEVSSAQPLQAVHVVCSTTAKDHFLPVPPSVRTCQEAVAWTFGMRADEYQPAVES